MAGRVRFVAGDDVEDSENQSDNEDNDDFFSNNDLLSNNRRLETHFQFVLKHKALAVRSPALSVAFFIAVRRAPCSAAVFSTSAVNTWLRTYVGSSRSRITGPGGDRMKRSAPPLPISVSV